MKREEEKARKRRGMEKNEKAILDNSVGQYSETRECCASRYLTDVVDVHLFGIKSMVFSDLIEQPIDFRPY